MKHCLTFLETEETVQACICQSGCIPACRSHTADCLFTFTTSTTAAAMFRLCTGGGGGGGGGGGNNEAV